MNMSNIIKMFLNAETWLVMLDSGKFKESLKE